MKVRRFSFKTKLVIFLEVFVLIVNFSLGYFFWRELQTKVRDISRQKLISIASTAAILIDAEKHESIQSPADEDGREYSLIQTELQKIKQANSDVDDIYTLKVNPKNDIWSFVVSASDTVDKNGNGQIEEDEKRVEVGEEFDVSELPEMRQSFLSPTADHKINCDKWGCWLSGYAPLKNSLNQTVGVVGVDISANDIMAFESRSKIFFGIILLAIMIMLPLGLYIFLLLLLRPITRIVSGLEGFSRDLSSRIDLQTGDEFELIANTFNMMAKQLEDLYLGLEKKVKEKTLALADKLDELTKEKIKDEALLESIGEGMIAIDHNGVIMMINSPAKLLLGIGKKDISGVNFDEIVKIENESKETIPLEKRPAFLAIRKGVKTISSQYYYNRGENRFPIFMVSTPIKFKEKIIGAIIIFRDISEEKRIDKAKTEFVSLASHQLRTPLSSISWHAEMLLDEDAGALKKEQRKYLEKIAKSSAQMTSLVRELLNVSRLEMGTFIVENSSVRIGALLKSVLNEFREDLGVKHLKIDLLIEKSFPIINSDPKLLQIIFQNLISNAIKYTPNSGKISLNVKLDSSNNFIFTISDTGLGIPKSQQKNIFSKFFRADNVKEREIDGTGLGLYIIKSITDNAGGKIDFRSKEDIGTTFEVSFPKSGMKEKKGQKQLS